ncbi:amino acid adenylation domain-containing protein [Micromonospora sp. NPDC048830]|uniref:amino acid adenylation domain-containing protein n=1 Tax=Micromonospora sp. NPDC048830 TaxID=3364257 RepID=UPI00371DCD2D
MSQLSPEQQKLLRLRLAQMKQQQAERPSCFHELFEAQARRFPDRVAVVSGDAQLSYAALDRMSNQLAHLLRSQGVGPETLVGLCVPRSLEMVVGILAILKAGGAYVPLDPTYPRERLAYMVADSQARVLLTRQSLAELLPDSGATVLDVETVWPRLADHPADAPAIGVTPDNLAYVIYTSGSTGQPKGVQVPHRGIRFISQWHRDNYGLDTPRRVMQGTPLSFDISVWEITIALLSGSVLVLPPADLRMIGSDLADFVIEQAIENISITPSALATLPPASLPSLQFISVGGESCPLDLARAWATDRAFFNGYGPTETTVGASIARYGKDLERIHIGRPIPNTQVYILDSRLQPLPVGVAGELYIGGSGVTRGYLGRPDLTAEVFIADPFGKRPGGRLYKTGDRARFLPDGNIEFLGRIDHQVKIRGFRIELGEIESALAEHPQVQSAAVLVHEEANTKRLIAYVVAREPLSLDAMQAFLGDRLPSYMVPSILVPLDQLPLDPNGKLDRRALAALPWEQYASGAKAEYVAPRTYVEEQLAQIWQAVLGAADPVSIHDNFFALGGDSILSLQVIFRAKQAGLHFNVKQLFQYQTIAELSHVVVQQDAASVQAEQGLVTGPVELTPIQRWFFAKEFVRQEHFNQAFLLEVPAELTPEQWQRTLLRLLEHHDGLRARYVRGEDGGWQAELAGSPEAVPWQVHDLSATPAADRADQLLEITKQVQASFDLADGPLVRAVLFTGLADGRHRLLLAVHHLVVDVVSWRILLEDLAALSEQVRQGQEPALPAKSSSWQQWAARLRQEASSEATLAELPYWLEQVEPVQPLPLDGPDSDNTVSRSRACEVSLGREETQALLQDVPAAFNTRINDVLLTAVAAALGSWTQGSHVRVDLEGHGREDLFDDVDLSRTVGWFTTVSPVRLPVPSAADPAEGLKEVKELLRRRPRQGIGYGLLLSNETEAGAQLRQAPAAQVSFNYIGELDGAFTGNFALAQEAIGPDVGPENQRLYLIDIVSRIQDGELRMQWNYHETAHQQETIERVARQALEVLNQLAAEARRPGVNGYSPSDLPISGLNQAEIDELVDQLRALSAWTGSELARPLEDVYPQTPLQQGLWFQSQYAQGQGLYHVQVVLQIEQDLQVDAFRQSWAEAMRRNPILRTSFWSVPEHGAIQLVWRNIPVPLEVQDWRSDSPQQQERLDAYLKQERNRGFDPHEIPQWRMLLARTGDENYQFVLSAHHAILDGWSNSLLLAEVVQSYGAFVNGRQPALQPARPYRDYVAWLGEQDMQEAERYWRELLQGAEQAAPLSVEKKSEPVSQAPDEPAVRLVSTFLSDEDTAALQKLAQDHHLTLNTVLQGCWALLLGRYSRSEDVIFGTVVSGRPPEFEGAERMVGLFINSLPVRVQMPGQARRLDWLQRLQDQNTQMRQYEYSPLLQVQQWSEIPADGQLFDSLFVFENYPVQENEAAALRFTLVDAEERTHFPLNVVINQGEQLGVSILYDTRRFDGRTVDGMLAHMRQVCRELASAPQKNLAELTMLTETERAHILDEWPTSTATGTEPQFLHELFEAQAMRTPDSIALVYEEEQLSYAELNRRANQLAHWLQARGVGPEVLVALCMERSVEVLVGLLGVLKAGGGYVPMDPGYPPERLSFLIEDAGVKLVLTQSHVRERVPAGDLPTLSLDTEWSAVAGEPTEAPRTGLTPENLAYIIYTSGSTGRPKGVMVPHRGVNHIVPWRHEHECFTRRQRVLQVASYSFDFSVWEIILPLLAGGTLYIPKHGLHMIGNDLHDVVVERAIENLSFTPGALATLPKAELPHLRTLVVGGEAYSPELIRTWAPGRTFFNVYGPTETTVFATGTPIDEHLDVLHMGRPITNVETYVLDPYMQPVPVGVPGELYIGGVGVTRGYLNRPELTAEMFVANPFGEPGSRLYKSGDLVRYLPDGNIEYVSRTDHQVKIRGFRIELGEIEAVLGLHPQVNNCAVLVLPDGPSQRLVAYVEPESGAGDISEALRAYLGEKLPRHMVPSAFVCMEQLPLNQNGKLNRRALPLPEETPAAALAANALPRTKSEALLATVFEQVLGRAPIGIFDDFFALGGHSLLAVQVVARIRQAFGVEMPIRLLFEHPIIARLAGELERLQQDQAPQQAAPPLVPVSRDQPLPATFDQQRLWFMDRLNPNSAFYTIGWLLHWPEALEGETLRTALAELTRRHEPFRTTFHEHDSRVWQVVAEEGEVALTEVDLSSTAPEQQQSSAKELIQEWWNRPFDLAQGPLLRAMLIRLSAAEAVLVFSAHHIVFDGYSIRLFNEEVRELYHATAAARPAQLPALPIQHADYAVWQQQWLEEERLRPHLDYWKEQLADAPELISLPLDKPRPAVQSFRGANLTGSLSSEVTQQLKQVSGENQTTHFITALSAFAVLLSRYSGQEKVVIGVPIANRNRIETEPLIGFLVNTVALCVDLQGNPGFADVLKQVRWKLLDAQSHQEIPFEKIVEELNPERSSSYSPIFQVMFTGLDKLFEETPEEQEEPAWMREVLDEGIGIAKFDLLFSIQEKAGALQYGFEYNTDLFEERTVVGMAEHFEVLIQEALSAPDKPVSELPLLSAAQVVQRLEEWNATRDDRWLRPATLHGLFEDQARRSPDHIALSFEDQTLTYAELDRHTNQLARTLRAKGVGPESRVGICAERSLELVIGLLAILKAGGAYVPLDPAYPADRLAFMVSDARIQAVLVQPQTQERIGSLVGQDVPLVQLSGGDAQWPQESAEPLANLSGPDNLAYVIYTSGSTGKPKGAMLGHQGICNRLLWMQDTYSLQSEDRVLQKTPFSFDVSVWEFFWPLITGARLHVARPDGHRDPAYLAEVIDQQRITVLHFVPSMLQSFLEQPSVAEHCQNIRHVMCSGEALPLDQQERFLRLLPGVRLHNLYGPTEASVDVSFWECHPAEGATTVPIGRPVANTQLYVLNQAMMPVPDGVIGELFIGGVQLARGYLGRPDLTAERFVANPFGEGRLYATGDLARHRRDGVIEYVGRKDHQIKIRGHRIEVGEIEAVLAQHPALQSCLITVHEVSAADKRLAAFYTVNEGQAVTVDELKDHLLQQLPEYMVPTYFVDLPEFPLSPNGKVDRKALPSLSSIVRQTQERESFVAPRTETERTLGEIWTRLLNVERVGVHDDFFDLGGHSLLVASLATEVQSEWDVSVMLPMVFQNRTLEALARVIDESLAGDDGEEMDADDLFDLD